MRKKGRIGRVRRGRRHAGQGLFTGERTGSEKELIMSFRPKAQKTWAEEPVIDSHLAS